MYKKCLNVRQKLGTRNVLKNLKNFHFHYFWLLSLLSLLSLFHSLYVDMLNNFCFHVYAQKSLSHSNTSSLSQCLTLTLSLSHSLTHHMLNNFCFHVYAQKSLSHFLTLSMSHSHSLIHSSLSTC